MPASTLWKSAEATARLEVSGLFVAVVAVVSSSQNEKKDSSLTSLPSALNTGFLFCTLKIFSITI